MRLSRYTDYALRVLLYLGVRPGSVSPVATIAATYGISQNHLSKVVHDLGKAGYVTSVRGRLGGIQLGRDPAAINVGAIIRHGETDLQLFPCPDCLILPACSLANVVDEALAAFLAVFDRYTLADLLDQRIDGLRRLLDLPPTSLPAATPKDRE